VSGVTGSGGGEGRRGTTGRTPSVVGGRKDRTAPSRVLAPGFLGKAPTPKGPGEDAGRALRSDGAAGGAPPRLHRSSPANDLNGVVKVPSRASKPEFFCRRLSRRRQRSATSDSAPQPDQQAPGEAPATMQEAARPCREGTSGRHEDPRAWHTLQASPPSRPGTSGQPERADSRRRTFIGAGGLWRSTGPAPFSQQGPLSGHGQAARRRRQQVARWQRWAAPHLIGLSARLKQASRGCRPGYQGGMEKWRQKARRCDRHPHAPGWAAGLQGYGRFLGQRGTDLIEGPQPPGCAAMASHWPRQLHRPRRQPSAAGNPAVENTCCTIPELSPQASRAVIKAGEASPSKPTKAGPASGQRGGQAAGRRPLTAGSPGHRSRSLPHAADTH